MQPGSRCRSAVTVSLLLCAAALISLGGPRSAAAHASASHTSSASSGPAAPATSAASVWGGSYFPDVELVSHQGKGVRFYSDLIKGKVVLINFIYTSCPDECALETARLREVQRILGDRVGRDVFIYSITIDPAHDTPTVLRQYAEKFEAGPGWLFLTGKDADITQLRKKFGLYSDPDQGGKLENHNLSLIMGNQSTGQWMKISSYENPYVLANQLGSWLHNWKLPPMEQRDYAQAPKLRNITTGEGLYRTRCAACHTLGAKPEAGSEKRPLGPDLLGVTHKREQAWLTRWLAETDQVLAEKDAVAMELLARYNNLPMPNLRLSHADIEALLDYIEAESHRLEHHHDHAEGDHHEQSHHSHEEMEMHEHGGE
jgi:protein SCO1